MMKESAAWRRIAVLLDAWTGTGEGFLCLRVDELYYDDEVIDVITQADMKGRISEYLAGIYAAYDECYEGGDTCDVNRQARVMAALWFAEEAEADEQEALDEEEAFV